MAPLDTAVDYPDISADEPAGPNLEFDVQFIELERLAQGKTEQQYGNTVIPAEEPDWKGVVALAPDLLSRSYDLRVLSHLAVARLHLQGVPGYAETLAVIRHQLEMRWASVHPQLDPDDDNDPTLRANGLLRVAAPGPVLEVLRTMPLARSMRAGAVSWRSIALSAGMLQPTEDEEKPNEAAIVAAFRETDPAALATLRDAVASAATDLSMISAVFDRESGFGTGPDFAKAITLLKDIARSIDRYRPSAEAVLEETGADAPETVGADQATPQRTRGDVTAASLSAVTNRTDAMRLLDLVVRYYQENEPSSPLPLLITRARRLAEKSFIDVLRDLAPDGVSQAETVVGRQDD